jgi:hypothetical protein
MGKLALNGWNMDWVGGKVSIDCMGLGMNRLQDLSLPSKERRVRSTYNYFFCLFSALSGMVLNERVLRWCYER